MYLKYFIGNKLEENAANSVGRFVSSCFEWVDSIITAIVVCILFLAFIFRIINVSGVSMMDTLLDGDKVIITDLLYKPSVGDIVVINRSEELSEPIIKRIIAKEGQSLSIDFDSGDVTVDGVVINEPYIKSATTKKGSGDIPEVIPKGYVFVMGDNRDRSKDSRSKEVGLINVENILGKAKFIIYPMNRVGVVR